MALLFISGFSEYASPSTYYLAGATAFTVSTTGGRFGGRALFTNLSGGGEHYEIIPGWFNPSGIVGFAYKFTPGGKAGVVAAWRDLYPDGTIIPQLELYKDANDTLSLRCNGTVLVKGTHPLLTGRYYFLEWKSFIKAHLDTSVPDHPQWVVDVCDADTNQLRIDGVLECSVPAGTLVGNQNGVNGYYTIPGTSLTLAYRAVCGKLWLVHDNFQIEQWFDDVYAADTSGTANNDFLGDLGVDILTANAVGTHDAWGNSGGANKVVGVNEVEPDGDSSFITSGTTGQSETYTFPSMRSDSVAIAGVQVQAVARKTDLEVRNITLLANGGDSSAVSLAPGDQYSNFTYVWNVNPATSAAWLPAGVNALEAGIKLVS